MALTQPIDSFKFIVTQKVLHRFYEPLGLLHALGKARGEHTHKTLPSYEQIDSSTSRDIRRQFLDELAFLCDHEKGGATVTAIGLEQTPQGYVFWVAANERPEKKIAPFLVNLLVILESDSGKRPEQALAEDIFRISVSFAHARIKTYATFLLSDLKKLMGFPACKNTAIAGFIASWKRKLDEFMTRQDPPHTLVQHAYENRHSEFMRRLATLAHGQHYKTSEDSLQAVCTSARHHIGRLGLHARSATALARYTPRMKMIFLESYSVRIASIPIFGNGSPPPRKATTAEAALGRMMPKEEPEFQICQQALAQMDGAFKISERFREGYGSSKNRKGVHAEVQVLQHFHEFNKDFAEGDKYVACSKPACFCCHLYFRHHPGGFAEPRSHRKIYLNWQPPGVPNGAEPRDKTQLRRVLNLMIQDIRNDARSQLIERAGPRIFHPDSVTGISNSVLDTLELDTISISADGERAKEDPENTSSDYSSFSSDNAGASSSSIALPGVDIDTDDEEGGVPLLNMEETSA